MNFTVTKQTMGLHHRSVPICLIRGCFVGRGVQSASGQGDRKTNVNIELLILINRNRRDTAIVAGKIINRSIQSSYD